MNISELDYNLPPERIAVKPAQKRDASRLMVLDRKTGEASDQKFTSIVDYLNPGDLVVYNNTRVIPARIFGTRETGGKVEILLHRAERGSYRQMPDGSTTTIWTALINSSRGPKPEEVITIDDDLSAQVLDRLEDGQWRIVFHTNQELRAKLLEVGRIPLPPYIVSRRRELEMPESIDEDANRYQTVFAQKEGSIAAPTAGLHFTWESLAALQQKGVRSTEITLHVGLGTFLPLRGDTVEENRLLGEYYNITPDTIDAIKRTMAEGKRVVAVGTTVVRALEWIARKRFQPGGGELDLFIYPGFEFKVVGALLTNFHLPKSSLLALAAAFAGKRQILEAYQKAIELEYRFYSYGDAMLIV